MSDDNTPRLQLPYLAAAQAQKHVTLNESLDRLDALVACRAKSRTIATPPVGSAEGDLFIAPAAGATGVWAAAGAGDLLRWADGMWSIEPAPPGSIALVEDEARLCVREPDGWVTLGERLGEAQALTRLGVGTSADPANPLAAKLNAALFTATAPDEGGTGDLRLTLNKAAAANVLSLLFQTGYGGRAEIGLVGDDRLKLRVSADGAAFLDALTVESDGRIGLNAAPGAAHLAVGGLPPLAGALSVVGQAGGLSVALSDNTSSSLYVRNAVGGAIVGTDDGGLLNFASGGNGLADRKVTLDHSAGLGESAMLLWIDSGAGLVPHRISMGAPDSAGPGYRQLRLSN